MTRQPRHRSSSRVPCDDGMTLIEVVVALALFAVMSTAVLAVLASAITTTRDDKARIEAVNLASRELEIVRDSFTSLLRGPEGIGDATNPNQLVGGTPNGPIIIDGVPFTVKRSTRWEPVGSGTVSPCDNGSSDELAYLHVTVEVRWPELGRRPPVTMDTVMTPPKGTYSALQTRSYIGLKVIDGKGLPKAGVRVSATSTSGTKYDDTAADGCALLEGLAPGVWTVTASAPGFVTPSGAPTATLTVQLQPAQLWRGSIDYDQASTILATLVPAEEGFALPDLTNLPTTLGNSAIQPIGAKIVAGSGDSRNITNLWPYPSGYEMWAGSCQDGGPTATGLSQLVPVTPGSVATTTITLGALRVLTTPNAVVTARHLPDPPGSGTADLLCPGGLQVSLGTADGDGELATSLPYGAWAIVVGSQRTTVAILPVDASDPDASPAEVSVP